MINILKLISSDKEQVERFAPYCNKAEKSFSDEPVFFMENDFIMECGEFAGLDENVIKRLIELSLRMKNDLCLRRLVWLCYFLFCKSPDYLDDNFKKWPDFFVGMGKEDSALLFLLVAVAGIRLTQKKHAESNIPTITTRSTVSDVKVHLDTYFQISNHIGISPKSLGWFRNWMRGELYCLGRFQYMIKPFGGSLEVYKNKLSGKIVALAADGREFNEDGYCPVKEKFNESVAWTSKLITDNDFIRGNAISPYGYALKGETVLDKKIWECIVDQTTMFMDVHIPAGGGMSLETCRESMCAAAAFFEQYYPKTPLLGFQCFSWILNPEFGEMLDSKSNLVKFERELYLFPIESGGFTGVDRVFGSSGIDLATAPRKTSLQKAMLGWLEAKRPLRGGGMLFMKDDLHKFGTSFYQRNFK